MKEELKEIINEYLETLKESHPVYDEDGSFDRNVETQSVPTFTGFIKFITK